MDNCKSETGKYVIPQLRRNAANDRQKSQKLQSIVTEKNCIKMVSDREIIGSDEELVKCGRWMLSYPNSDQSWADKALTDLQALVENGCLILLNSATCPIQELGAILCFTRPGQEEAIKAAEAIREVVRFEDIMYYKLDEINNEGVGRNYGDWKVSRYMHTFLGHFYVRDAIERWKFLDTLNEPGISGRNHEALEARNFPSELQPLPSSGRFLDLNHYSETGVPTRRELSSGHFNIKCTLQRDEDGLAEADYVWSAVKSLYDDGNFIRLESYPQEGRIAYISCYVADSSDLQFLVDIAKRIFRETRLSSVIHFCIQTGAKKRDIKYFFTPQGELYEELRDGIKKFVLDFQMS